MTAECIVAPRAVAAEAARVAESAGFLLDVCRLVERATLSGWTVTASSVVQFVGRDRAVLLFHRHGREIEDDDILAPLGEFWRSLHPGNTWDAPNTFWRTMA